MRGKSCQFEGKILLAHGQTAACASGTDLSSLVLSDQLLAACEVLSRLPRVGHLGVALPYHQVLVGPAEDSLDVKEALNPIFS